MAKIIYRKKGTPPKKATYLPASRLYKRLFLLSVSVNVLLTILMYYKG